MHSTLNAYFFYYIFLFLFFFFTENVCAFTKIIAHFHYIDSGILSILYTFYVESLAWKMLFILSCLWWCECRQHNKKKFKLKKKREKNWIEIRHDEMQNYNWEMMKL